MIHVDRSGVAAPPVLAKKRKTDLGKLRSILKQRRLESGDFNSDRYGSAREKLLKAQSGKCCYCEKEVESNDPVEHFRPRTSVRRARSDDPVQGYWWLAYCFDNLHLACWSCNINKTDLFPIFPGGKRLDARHSKTATLRAELPQLIDPANELCGDRPEDHLTFEWIDNEGYRIAPINSSERGRATIDVMALDRDDLNEMRKKYYARTIQPVIQDFKDAESAQDHKGMAKHQNRARALVAKNAPFSLMASVAFREAGILV